MMIILSNNSATMIDDDILRNIILVSRYFIVASLLTKHQDDHGGWRMEDYKANNVLHGRPWRQVLLSILTCLHRSPLDCT